MTLAQKWLLAVGAVLLAGWLVSLLSPVLTPFLVAAILAYLFDPLADRLETRFSRTVSVLVIFLLLFALLLILLLILIPALQTQLVQLIRRLPDILDWFENTLLPMVSSLVGVDAGSIDLEAIRKSLEQHWAKVGNVAGLVIGQITESGLALLAWLANLILIPVVMFYLLRDWDGLMHNFRTLIPNRHRQTVVDLARDCDRVLSEFLRGQLLVMLALAAIYSLGLWIAGIDYALLVGSVAGLISFIPYLGSIVGIVVALIIAFFQYHDILHLVLVGLIFGVGQAIEGMVLSPWLVGDRIGLHPVAVIFAVLAGGQLFGFTGVLLALPVAAVSLVVLRFGFRKYQATQFYT